MPQPAATTSETPLLFQPLAESVLARSEGRPFFLEIGAMDGVQYDLMYPLAKTGAWDGVLVEPMPDMYAALIKNYADVPGLRFALCAVGDHDGKLWMTRAHPELIQRGIFPPEYLGMTTSVRREAFFQPGKLTRAQEELVARGLVQVEVPCCTLPTLIEQYGITKIDVLMIDTEGTDWTIAKQLDWARFRPSLVCLEYAHFSAADKAECLRHFEELGYAHAPCAVEDLNRLFFDPMLVG